MANTVDYFEIGSPDPQRSAQFYGGLFDWQIGGPAGPASYRTVDDGGGSGEGGGHRGGLWDTTTLQGENWAIFYVQVDDVPAAFARAQELGAAVAIPVTDNGRIEFAHLIDPIGNRFGIWKPKS